MGDVKYFWNATQSFASSLVNNVQAVQRLTTISHCNHRFPNAVGPELRHALQDVMKLFYTTKKCNDDWTNLGPVTSLPLWTEEFIALLDGQLVPLTAFTLITTSLRCLSTHCPSSAIAPTTALWALKYKCLHISTWWVLVGDVDRQVERLWPHLGPGRVLPASWVTISMATFLVVRFALATAVAVINFLGFSICMADFGTEYFQSTISQATLGCTLTLTGNMPPALQVGWLNLGQYKRQDQSVDKSDGRVRQTGVHIPCCRAPWWQRVWLHRGTSGLTPPLCPTLCCTESSSYALLWRHNDGGFGFQCCLVESPPPEMSWNIAPTSTFTFTSAVQLLCVTFHYQKCYIVLCSLLRMSV